jgi:tetratricopeptide (TPR) repeat protein
MAQIIEFPAQASKLGYRPVKKRAKAADHPDQLVLFPSTKASILNLSPDLSTFERALTFDERDDLKAAELYQKAIEEHDCVADAYCNLGIIESKKGNTTKAFGCFTTSLKHNARHSEAHYNLGNLYFELNDFRLAQIHYEMAGEVDPLFANAYFNLALVQGINNDFGGAVNALAKYRELVSEDEGRIAAELLQNLKSSLGAVKNSQQGSSGS